MQNYKHILVKKFIGLLIKRGNKSKASTFFFNTLALLRKQQKQKSLVTLIAGLSEVRPLLTYKVLRKGQKVIYLPKLMSTEEQLNLAINWVLDVSRKNRQRKPIAENLAAEVVASIYHKSGAWKKKEKINYLLLDSRPFLYLLKNKV